MVVSTERMITMVGRVTHIAQAFIPCRSDRHVDCPEHFSALSRTGAIEYSCACDCHTRKILSGMLGPMSKE